ncbi:unnamed protein product [Amoebophrya sp. A120]|nr:unnamed protein product [Amoebophrya sp. A120]|eukprot:GSA120T00017762001.1
MTSQHTLVALLETSGPSDEVLSFLHGGDIAGLACVSKQTRKAVQREDGKLKCINLVIRFKCDEVPGSYDLTAQTRDLGHIFARVDVRAVKTLFVEVHAKFVGPGTAEENALDVNIDPILPQVQSLMFPEVQHFGLAVYDVTPAGTLGYEDLGMYLDPERCDESVFNRFARSLVALRNLRTLFLPGKIAEQGINFPGGVRTQLPELQTVHIMSYFNLSDVDTDSLLHAVLADEEASTGDETDDHAVVGSAAAAGGVTAQGGLVAFSCFDFDMDGVRRLAPDSAGAALWRKAVGPSLRKLSLRGNLEFSNEDGDEGELKWFWSRCSNVTHIELSGAPPKKFWRERLPSLQSITFAGAATCGRRAFRPDIIGALISLDLSKIRLAFYDFGLAAIEFGALLYKVAHENKQGHGWDAKKCSASPLLHNKTLLHRLNMLAKSTYNKPDMLKYRLTSGPPLCPMAELEVTAGREAA